MIQKTAALMLMLFFLCGCSSKILNTPPFDFFQKTVVHNKTTECPSLPEVNTDADTLIIEEAAAEETPKQPPDLDQGARMQAALDEALEFCKASQTFWQQGRFENAIQALDQAYALLLEADAGSDSDLLQQKEDLRFLISKRTLEIYASRHTIVNGTHKAIPVIINKDVKKEIQYSTTGKGREFFIASYKRSGKYRPMIEKRLEKAGLPAELSWLPLIESGFKTHALSRARALGLWQFISSTGYKFGLERNVYIDERLDPEKATDAAIEYLKTLHQIFGDWATVLAAYNCGEGRVLRTIRTKNINYLDNFWDLYHQLPRETARYVPKFLATLHIVANLDKYGLGDLVPDPPLEYETITVCKQAHLKDLAKAMDVSYNDLKDLNPALRHQVLPDKQYKLHIPVGKQEMLLARIDSLPIRKPPQQEFVYHRIRRGESLSTIARRYRTTMSNIARANNIYRYNRITAGKLLKIPVSKNWQPAQAPPTAQVCKGPANHVVRRGESLWLIARKYGATVSTIQAANNLSGTTLTVGQVLKIPGDNDTKHYQVKKGDSPFTIATRHKMSLQHFLSLNNMTPNNKIYPGQTVYVK